MIRKLLFTLIVAHLSLISAQPAALAADTELVPSSRVILKIAPGMTIDDIIRRIYPKDKDLWSRIKDKLIETNPNSFVQYSDRLISGTRLKLVDIKRVYAQDAPVTKIRVGYVAELSGRASTRDASGQEQQLHINSQVFEGDRIQTEAASQLYILLDDGAELYLKADSVLKITEYVINSSYDKDSSSVLDLLRGGLRKITGAIGDSKLANYQMQTGLATIGIRGTEYVVKLCQDDDCTQTVSRNDPDAKLHAVVLEGAISLTTDDEVKILLAQGEYGTATPETLVIEDDKPIPAGFLDAPEAQQFKRTVPQAAQQTEEETSSTWKWILGIVLIAAGL